MIKVNLVNTKWSSHINSVSHSINLRDDEVTTDITKRWRSRQLLARHAKTGIYLVSCRLFHIDIQDQLCKNDIDCLSIA